MNRKLYLDWIQAQNLTADGYGKCAEVTREMVKAFPELERRRGIFHSTLWGDRTHWWCRHKETGLIVDPTAKQHPDGYYFPVNDKRYTDLTDVSEQEAIERDIIPIGKCPNCGAYVYHSSGFTSVCSEECSSQYEAYLNGLI